MTAVVANTRLAIYIKTDITTPLKPVRFVGDVLQRLRDFPNEARQDVGYQLDRIQRGLQPTDFKPMPSIGRGIEDIRVWDESGTFRVIYTARLAHTVYVPTLFRRDRKPHRSRTSRSQGSASPNSSEVHHDHHQDRELRQCLGCAR